MKRLHFYEEGAWLWSLAMELEARERSSSRKISMARASLCSKEGKRALYIGILGLA